jgi:hypothetical protein
MTIRSADRLFVTSLRLGSSDQSNNQQEYDRADRRADDDGYRAGAGQNPKPSQQPSTDKSADDTDQHVADNAESGTLHNLPGKPSGDQTNQ